MAENGKVSESTLPQYAMYDGVHSPVLIGPTPMQVAPKKRCRVCYAAKKRREVRYCCGACPERPGLCLEPCFVEFHRSMLSVTAPALIFSGTLSVCMLNVSNFCFVMYFSVTSFLLVNFYVFLTLLFSFVCRCHIVALQILLLFSMHLCVIIGFIFRLQSYTVVKVSKMFSVYS